MSCSFEALVLACTTADNLSELSGLMLAGVNPVGGFAILEEVEPECFDAKTMREGSVVQGELDEVPVNLRARPLRVVS